jgi:hypothetical protein
MSGNQFALYFAPCGAIFSASLHKLFDAHHPSNQFATAAFSLVYWR